VPRVTLSTSQVRVVDDLLPAGAFAPLRAYAESIPYVFIHEQTWHKAWQLTDGLPLFGIGTHYRDDGAYSDEETPHYPTRTPLDPLLDAIRGAAGEAEAVVGKSGADWTSIVLNPFIHPRGTGLSIHRDGRIYSGAVVFYVHHEWDVHWGGHLLLLDQRTGADVDLDDVQLRTFLSTDHATPVVSDPGLALCILPKPNRLVLLRGDVLHMITRIDADAGDRPRITFSGFFVVPS
jgi:hypothetical protein